MTQWHSPTGNKDNRPDCHDTDTHYCDGVPVEFNLRNYSNSHPNPYSPCAKLQGLTLELNLVNKTWNTTFGNIPENRTGSDTIWCANEKVQDNQHAKSRNDGGKEYTFL